MIQLVNQLINDKGVCRTAPATPGLLNTHVSTNPESEEQRMEVQDAYHCLISVLQVRQVVFYIKIEGTSKRTRNYGQLCRLTASA